MSGPGRFRSLAFGDIDGELWGGGVDLGSPALALGLAGSRAASATLVQWSEDGSSWTLRGEGVELRVTSGSEAPPDLSPEPSGSEVTGLEELCRVEGNVTIEGSERAVDCVGTRCVVDGIDAGAVSSMRFVSGWFADDEAFGVLSFRARRAVGHESDLIAATLFDPQGWVPVTDPRLSTTYAASGLPERASLELWIGEGENEFPRRAAAEAAGTGAGVQADGFELRVVPLHCHSRGLEGSGVYVLATL
jgi:hypothetical protein